MNELTLSDVIARLENQVLGPFTISQLYSQTEWNKFTKSSRIRVGKEFKKAVAILNKVNYLGDNTSNSSQYEKI